MPSFDGVEHNPWDLPDGSVVVDDYSRFRIDHDNPSNAGVYAVEHYPWPFKHPWSAALQAWDVFMWHVDMVRQHGFESWNHDRKF